MTIFESESTYVAFLDILGFKDLVTENSQEKLTEIYNKLYRGNIQLSLSLGEINVYNENGVKMEEPDIDIPRVNSILISDSIIYWTNKTDMIDFVSLITAVRYLLASMIHSGLPMRGAIYLGPLTVQKVTNLPNQEYPHMTFFGKAITWAYSEAINQNWAGCVIDGHCIDKYEYEQDKMLKEHPDISNDPEFASVQFLLDKKLIAKYLVPYKKGPIIDKYVVDWVTVNDPIPTEQDIRAAFSAHNKDVDDWSVEEKIVNTLKFFKYISQNID